MKKIFAQIVRYFFAKPSIDWAKFWPSSYNISIMKRLNRIQLSATQLKVIASIVKEKAPCKLLIFGLGYDSLFWVKLNKGGITAFLEDDKDWFRDITGKSKHIKAFLIDYHTKINDWKIFLESPFLLDMTLPGNIDKEQWDIILIDAPKGYEDHNPGRMKGIFLSTKLIGNSGDIFVHDCNREVEDIFCSKFFKTDNLKTEIKAPIGLLRHYHIKNRFAIQLVTPNISSSISK